MSSEVENAQALIKAVYDDKCAEINGHDYKYLPTTHERRLKIFAYLMSVQDKISRQDFSFMGTEGWRDTVRIMENLITYNDEILSRRKEHWEKEEFSKDYIKLMLISLQVFSYPLL